MQKIVVNKCYGGFGLSKEFKEEYLSRTGKEVEEYDIPRDDSTLINILEDLGSEVCSGFYAKLQITEIPDDVEWCIGEYDGMEWVEESHRSW